jgi:hypothetical protein
MSELQRLLLDAQRIRRNIEINSAPKTKHELEKIYGRVWTTEEMVLDFAVEGYMAPFVVARRRSDGARGSLEFQSSPRYYFAWQEDTTQ